jgi:predicted nucleic acid-binding protein
MNYWDTSAIIKLYVPEPDSGAFLDLLTAAHEPIATSIVANVEMLCALHRKERGADLRSGGAARLYRKFLDDCEEGRIIQVPFGADVVRHTEEIVRIAHQSSNSIMIRSLDAVHIASAVVIKATTLVATDTRLRAVAALISLTVVP